MTRPGRNDPCYCGSGQKYKKCHLELDENGPKHAEWARTASNLYLKNLALLAASKEIFHLEKPWQQVKAGMTDSRIRAFYEFIAELWPPHTPIHETLVKPESNLRALYLGINNPEAMVDNVFRFSLYADEIVLINPFENPHRFKEQYNPIAHPEEWRMQTLRVVYQLAMLTPWVAAGIVILLPDPGDFNFPFLLETFRLAEKRLGKDFLSEEDVEEIASMDSMHKIFYLSPPEYQERKLREANLGVSDQEIRELLDFAAYLRKRDPLLIDDTISNMPGQFTATKFGANLEMGLYICQTIGAFPYTNVKFRWKELMSAAHELDPLSQVWSPLTRAFQQLDFRFLNKVDSEFAIEMRNEGRLSGFRAYLRKIWESVEGDIDIGKAEKYALDFKDELAGAYDSAKAEWESIDRALMKWAVPAIAGALGSVGAVATGHLNLALPGGGFAFKGINELIQAYMKRAEFRKKTPMSVFIDLDKKN